MLMAWCAAMLLPRGAVAHALTAACPAPCCSCSKKYQIEEMRGEDVVSRKRGFTVDTCVSGKTASEETPMFNGMSTGAKVRAPAPVAAAPGQ